MIEKERSEMSETGAAFVLTMVLINILLLSVIAGLIWFVVFVVNQNRSIEAIVHGRFLP